MRRLLLAALLLLFPAMARAACTADIVAARATGVAPLAVFFDATATDCTSTSLDFHEVTYVWNFDDTGAGNWTSFQGMPTRSKNVAFGPVAAHVFDPAVSGDTYNADCGLGANTCRHYTVTLTVKDGTSTDTDTVDITVTDPETVFSGANTICIHNTGGADCPNSGAGEVTTSSWATVVSSIASGKRVLLERGSTFTTSTTQTLSGTVGLVGAYGTGAKPIISMSGGGTPFQLGNGATDIRIMDLTVSGNSANALMSEPSATAPSQILYYRLGISSLTGFAVWSFELGSLNTFPEQMFFVDNTATTCGTYCWYGGAKHMAIMGNEFGSVVQHVIRVTHTDLSVIAGNYLHDAGGQQSLLKFHGEGWNAGECTKLGGCTYSGHAVVADNVFGEESGSFYAVFGPQNNEQDERVKDIIYERNFCRTNGSSADCVRVEAAQVTVRDNVMHFESFDTIGVHVAHAGIEGQTAPTETIPRSVWVYNNSAYGTSACASGCNGYLQDDAGAPTSIARNNLLYTPNSSGYFLTLGMGGWTTSNNTKASTNPFAGTPSITDPTAFELAGGHTTTTGGTSLVQNLVDFSGECRTGPTYAVGAWEPLTEACVDVGAPRIPNIEGGGCTGCSISDNF